MSEYNQYALLKTLEDQIGIPREDALKMTAWKIKALLAAHEFTIENQKRKLENEAKNKGNKLNPSARLKRR